MADDLIKYLGSWMVCVIFAGSVVDCVQFTWLMRRALLRRKRILVRQVKAQILLEEHNRKAGIK